MFGRAKRRKEAFDDGFRDALVHGVRDAGMYVSGDLVCERPGYQRGFDEGTQAVARIVRQAQPPSSSTLHSAAGQGSIGSY
jgi:hypothetical protein